jgi:ATP-dependent DNA helicase RecG
MLSDQELEALMHDLESDRTERKESLTDPGRIRQAICAFANDLPNHQASGVVFVGVRDNGSCANLPITDQLLRVLSDMRSDGNILPFPTLVVQKKNLAGCEVAVVVVDPSDYPPVRYNGRVWIRVGPRRTTATAEEERRLSEKRQPRDVPFDLRPIHQAGLEDLDRDLFQRVYLPSVLPPEILAANQRSVEDQLSSLRFATTVQPRYPTIVGMLVIGKAPANFIPGAYVQFLRLEGTDLTAPIGDQKELHGPVHDLLRRLDEVITAHIRIPTDIQSATTEIRHPDYPLPALQQFIRNAIMHRDYETSYSPVRITWFSDRVEIQNPGGPFGQVTQDNFGAPGITDYRNPHVAEALKFLGYVQRFGVGIAIARKALEDNGNPAPQFTVQPNHVLVTVRTRP